MIWFLSLNILQIHKLRDIWSKEDVVATIGPGKLETGNRCKADYDNQVQRLAEVKNGFLHGF